MPNTVPTQDESADRAPARRRRMSVAAVAGAALLATAGGFWLPAPKTPESESAGPADAVRQIKETASRYGAVVQVHASDSADAPVSVTGHIGTDRDRRSFLDELARTGMRAAVHLVSSEQLVEYVNAILEQSLNRDRRNKVEVTPVSHAPGELLISGYVERRSSLAETRRLLARDLKGSKSLTYQIETKADRLAVLRRRLDGLELDGNLRIQQLDGSISLFGPIRSDEELAQVRKLVENFNAEFDSRPPLRLEGTDSFLGVSTIDFDVRAVVLGKRIHVIAQDGTSYEKGSRIPGGHVVRTITERYMILEKPVAVGQGKEAEDPGLAYVIFEGA